MRKRFPIVSQTLLKPGDSGNPVLEELPAPKVSSKHPKGQMLFRTTGSVDQRQEMLCGPALPACDYAASTGATCSPAP